MVKPLSIGFNLSVGSNWFVELLNSFFNGSALVKPLSIGFNLSVGSNWFVELLNSFFNVQPPPSLVEPEWCLNKTFDFLKTMKFSIHPSLEDIILKDSFSVGCGFRQISLVSFILFREEGVS